jgi:hypothetical protein
MSAKRSSLCSVYPSPWAISNWHFHPEIVSPMLMFMNRPIRWGRVCDSPGTGGSLSESDLSECGVRHFLPKLEGCAGSSSHMT